MNNSYKIKDYTDFAATRCDIMKNRGFSLQSAGRTGTVCSVSRISVN